MDILLEELGFGLQNEGQVLRVVIRLLAAVLMGAVIGLERERAGKAAGLRTHILVTFGTTLFVLVCSVDGFGNDALSRVIQGITTGIGFIGAGSILKLTSEEHVKGLTTAAGIWVAAAIGVAIGLGSVGIAAIATILTVTVLFVLVRIEVATELAKKNQPKKEE